jgi:hypothetical protein
LPIPPLPRFDSAAPWQPSLSLGAWLARRILELTFTAWDLAPFARDLCWDGPPFSWHPERRFSLRCELDAAIFHLYGVVRGEVLHIMDSFPIVRRNDERAHGEFRTKRVILEIYDAIQEAMTSGRPYHSATLDALGPAPTTSPT